MMAERARGERGVSLIAAIFFLVIVAFMGTTLVSLMSTQSITSAGEAKSTQALYVAEGGSEFAQRALAMNLDWYRSAADPILTASTALGAGTFTISTYLPATELSRRVTPASATIPVFTTSRFPASGTVQLSDDIGSGGEFVRYTGVTATTFTGLTRNVTIGGVSGGAVGTFVRLARVYPVTTLSTALANLGGCAPQSAASFNVVAHSKLLSAGTITIDPEEISYTGSTTSGGVTTLTGVTRCVNSQSSGHAIGDPVTPLLADGLGAANYEALFASTGSVGNAGLGTAVRVVQKTVQR
jgi:hypothetical protein